MGSQLPRNRNSGNGFIEFFKREIGFCPPRNYSRRVSSSKNVIEHIDRYGELNVDEGAVNTLAFNSTVDHLFISGSNDNQVMLWEWETKKLISSYPSGHYDELLLAKIMPFTDDRKIITSAADGEVRLIELLDNGSSVSKILSIQPGHVNSLAVEPGSPHNFYTCGEDGFVKHYDLRSCSTTTLFFCPSVQEPGSRMGLFSMAIDPRNPNYAAAGGEDGFTRVYDIRNFQVNSSTKEGSLVSVFCPQEYSPEIDDVMITSLAYSSTSELLVSYSNNSIYLFQRNMGYPSIDFFCSSLVTSEYDQSDLQLYTGHRNINTEILKGVSFFGPNDEYVVSGSDCGRMFIWDKKSCVLVRSMVGDSEIVNQVVPHPLIPVLATCGSASNAKIWGPSLNKPILIEHIDRYGELNVDEGAVNTLAFNSTDDHLLISGTDDNQVMLWEWETKKLISSYFSGHYDDFLLAEIMPFTDDYKIITSATDIFISVWTLILVPLIIYGIKLIENEHKCEIKKKRIAQCAQHGTKL